MDKTLTDDQLEKAISLAQWPGKPDFMACSPDMYHLIKKEIRFWDDVMNPKIAQIFPGFLKKGN